MAYLIVHVVAATAALTGIANRERDSTGCKRFLHRSLQLVLKRVVRAIVVAGSNRRPNNANSELLLVLNRARDLLGVEIDSFGVCCREGP